MRTKVQDSYQPKFNTKQFYWRIFLIGIMSFFMLSHCFAQSELLVNDTRNLASSPNDLKHKIRFDFKNRAVIESPGAGMFSGLMTLAPWEDATGGNNYQLNFNIGGLYYRTGVFGATAWESWKRFLIEETNGNDAMVKIGAPNVQGNINVPVGASTGSYNLDFYTWRDILTDQIGARIRAERINNYQNNSALIQSMDLAFYTSTGGIQSDLTEKMRISSSGNVSIGTKDPKGYKLAVNGNIIAAEIKVQTPPWPDYVFSKNYDLPRLESIEKYIQKEGYLPDMPSAVDVEKNGINVGEMNVKFLKKIEELTLYIINQNKQLSNQQDQLNRLSKDNLTLKRAVYGKKNRKSSWKGHGNTKW